MKAKPALCAVAILIALASTASAAPPTNPPYVAELPSVERLKADIKGENEMDTAARQMGAFWQLREVIHQLAWKTRRAFQDKLLPDEKRLADAYIVAYNTAAAPHASLQNSPDGPQWYKMHAFYETSPEYLDDLLKRYCSPQFRTAFYEVTGKRPPGAAPPAPPAPPAAAPSVQPAPAQTSPATKPGAQSSPATKPAGNVNPVALNYLAQGEKLYDAKDYAKAIAAFKQSIAIQPTSGAYNDLGNCYYAQEKHTEAVAAYKEALRLNPDNPNAPQGIGQAYYALKQYPEALASFQQALKSKYSSPHLTHAWIGDTYRAMKKYDEALAAYRESVRLQPDYAYAHNRIGLVYLDNLSKNAEAIEAFQQAVRLKPDEAIYHSNVAAACYAAGQYDKAAAAGREAVRLAPNNAGYHNRLGLAYHDLEQYPQAVAEYAEAVRLAPDNANHLYNLGAVYNDMGKKDLALQVYRKLQAVDPKKAQELKGEIDKPAWQALAEKGDADFKREEYAKAIASYKQAMQAMPSLGSSYGEHGVYEGISLTDEQERWAGALKQHLARNPTDALALMLLGNLGVTFARMGRIPEAQRIQARLRSMDPKLAQQLMNIMRPPRPPAR